MFVMPKNVNLFYLFLTAINNETQGVRKCYSWSVN